MISLLVVCTGLIAATPPAAPDQSKDLNAYQAVQSQVGRDADAHVRLALWCEAHGLEPERLKQLALAVLANPQQAAARGMLGLVADHGQWRNPDAISEQARANAALAEYAGRRARTPETAEAQWKLALWCEKNGLKAEAMAHLTAVTRLDPSKEAAWTHLGCKKYHGRWVTAEQVAEAIADAEAQRKADRHWGPKLAQWKGWQAPAKRAEADADLATVTDARAVPSVWRVFGTGGPEEQGRATRLLGQIDGTAASRALAILAIFGKSEGVRQAAVATLKNRDPREFVDPLINLLRGPLRYQVKPAEEPGSVGTLFIEGEWYNLQRTYTTAAISGPVDRRTIPPQTITVTGTNDRARDAQGSFNAARRQLNEDIAAIDRYNVPLHQLNVRVLGVLQSITGQTFGESPDLWKSWWSDRKGYSYQAITTSQKPVFNQYVQTRIVQPPPQSRHSCFGAGTMVRTFAGPRPIETIQVGDRVLTQDTRTGALSFQPVLTVLHNPPNATFRIALDGETIVATGIHRFWKAGQGWVMARDLKPGDTVRMLGGLARVASVESNAVQPVFNLEVAHGRDFFVGQRGALVHDNSLVEPTPEPFDAKPTLAAVVAPAASKPIR